MCIELIIGLLLILFITASGLVANVGWQHETVKREKLEKMFDRANKQLAKSEAEIAELKSWVSILQTQGDSKNED